MRLVDIILSYREALLSGLAVTVELALLVWTLGLALGTLLGILSARISPIGVIARMLSFLLSGIPVLVFLFWAHYPLQAILGVVINPFYTAVVVLTTINVFAVADLVRAHLLDFPNEYTVAARVCGISVTTTVWRIQIPIIARQLIPALIPLQVVMLQTTLFASLISVEEIFRVCQRINAIEYRPTEIYTALAMLFLAVCLPLNGLAAWLRARFTRNLSEA